MIKVSFFYPYEDGAKFDKDYYVSKHMKLVTGLLGDACKGAEVEFGISGASPKMPPPFIAMAHLTFDSVESYVAAMKPHAAAFAADTANYTTLKPVMQVSDIKRA